MAEHQVPEGYQQTEVGVIPKAWGVKNIGDALSIRHGRDQKHVKCEDGLYPILGTGGEMGRTNTFLYDKPSVLIGRKGTINKPSYMDSPFWTVDTLFYSEVDKKYFAKFVYYKFCMIDWIAYNEASGVPSLNASTIESIQLSFPDNKKEQTAIANALSDVDTLITSLEKLIAKKRAIKTAAMQQLLTGKKRLPPFDLTHTGYKQTELGDIPEDWKVSKLGDMGFDVSDGNYSSKYPRSDEFRQTGVPFIRANNMKNLTVVDDDMRFISEKKHSDITKGHLKKDDVLITNRGEIGNLAIVPDSHIGSNINAQIVRINTKNSPVENTYFAYYLQKDEVQHKFQDLQTGSALKQLPVNRLMTLLVFYPSKEEQVEIAKFMSAIDSDIFALEQLLTKTQQLKQGMMQELLTGKTRLPFDKH